MMKIVKKIALAVLAVSTLAACNNNEGQGGGGNPYTADITTPANCYIVAPGSTVRFVANIGNSAEKAVFTTAELTWQDVKGMVTSVNAQAADSKVVVTLASGVEGNALVSVKDAEGKIVWNYHLWVTNYNPDENAMVQNFTKPIDGVDTPFSFVMMDRHLGAMANEVGSAASLGLHYNWGRPAPLFAAGTIDNSGYKAYYTIEGDTVATTLAAAVEDIANCVATAIANPTTQYNGGSDCNFSWLSRDYAKTAECDDMWGGVSNTQTKYDPCPAGWRVAPYHAYRFANTDLTPNFEMVKEYTNNEVANANFLGISVKMGEKSYYFPAGGESGPNGKFASGIGSTWPNGKVWSCVNDGANCRAWAMTMTPSSVSHAGGTTYSYALPVRCVKVQ